MGAQAEKERARQGVSPIINQPQKSCSISSSTFYLPEASHQSWPTFKGRVIRIHVLGGMSKNMKTCFKTTINDKIEICNSINAIPLKAKE